MLSLFAKLVMWLGVSALIATSGLTWYNYNNLVGPRASVKMIVNSCGGSGSVVSITPDIVLTAGHFTKGVDLKKCDLTVDGKKVDSVLKSGDMEKDEPDLAVLLVPGLGCPCAPLGTMPKVDDEVRIIGYPLGRQKWLSKGNVQDYNEMGRLWTDAHVAPGNSGGGIFAWQGFKWKLVGITSGMLAFHLNPFLSIPLTAKSVGVDVNTIKAFISDLE